jgi:hypothetical protein
MVEAWMFVMRLSASGKAFHFASFNQAQEVFIEGHVRAFAYFGGVVTRVRYEYVPRNIFGNHDLRNPAEKLEGGDVRGDPVDELLAAQRFGEEVRGSTQHRWPDPDS